MTLYAAEQHRDHSSATVTTLSDKPWWPWAWMAVATAFLAGSGAIRTWQDGRFEEVEIEGTAPMFPLRELPTKLGRWQAREGTEEILDPRVARIAGSTDSLIRNYVEKETGVVVTLLILYGRADQVIAHTPDVCYPAIGYKLDENVIDEMVPAGNIPAAFRSTVYARKGAVTERQEVYYAFRSKGAWMPNIAGNWRELRNTPSVFKIQVQRRAGELERRHLNNPTKAFLAALIPELEQRIRAAEGGAPIPTAGKPGEDAESKAEKKTTEIPK